MSKPYFYGGQAVMEGVMMRGRKSMAVACRAPNGLIHIWEEDLNPGPILRRVRNIPFVRGAVVLWDTMVLGTRSLMFSANISLQDVEGEESTQDTELSFPWVTISVLALIAAILGYLVAPPVAGFITGIVGGESWESNVTWGARVAIAAGAIALIIGTVRGHRSDLERAEHGEVEEPESMTGILLWFTVAISLLFAIGLFFVIPVGGSAFLERYIDSHFTVNLLEGVIRLIMLVGYLWLIARMEDIRRVFAYHGAEHKTIHTHEKNLDLEVQNVRPQPLEHIRCGTGFLLIVVLLSVLVFALLGRPNLFWLIASRILLVPVIAAIAFEVIRIGAAHAESKIVQFILAPGLMLQRLTTREPDDDMMEVSIAAFNRVAARDGLISYQEIRDGAILVDDLGKPLTDPAASPVPAD